MEVRIRIRIRVGLVDALLCCAYLLGLGRDGWRVGLSQPSRLGLLCLPTPASLPSPPTYQVITILNIPPQLGEIKRAKGNQK